jgi:hypothetical protein
VLPDILNSQRNNAANVACRFTLRLLYPKLAPTIGAGLARDRLAGFRRHEQVAILALFPSIGLGLYDAAFSGPYTIPTSASAYFPEDSLSTKLKYDARAAI